MKKIYYISVISCIIALTSCQSLETLTIDQLVPGDLSFPSSIRRVGVVNNVSGDFPNVFLLSGDTTKLPYEIARKVTYHEGNSAIATESLAEAIAEAQYFEEVIISDSLLRVHDINPRETTLSNEEVTELTESLGVDMIIALEAVNLRAIRSVSFFLEGGYLGIVDLKVNPQVNIYVPGRRSPLAGINVTDSIFWEGVFSTQVRAQTQVISETKMIDEASNFAGTLPVKHIVPVWKTVDRVYYSSNKSDMRDASVMARKGEWEKAYHLWKKVYDSNKKKDQMKAAINIALYYEIKDNLDEAIAWVEKSKELAKDIEKIDAQKEQLMKLYDPDGTSTYHIASSYLNVLMARKEQSAKLNMQMRRFSEEPQE
jgi:hypothetical protein